MIEYADVSLHEITCDEAWLYCATLTHNNKYDWRMPTYKERIASFDVSDISWDIDDVDNDSDVWSDSSVVYPIIPVRDIK